MGSCSGGFLFSTPIVSHTWNAVSCSAKKGLCCGDETQETSVYVLSTNSVAAAGHGVAAVQDPPAQLYQIKQTLVLKVPVWTGSGLTLKAVPSSMMVGS